MISFKEELKEWYSIYQYIEEMYDTLLSHKNEINDDIYKILYNKVFNDGIDGKLQKIYPFYWSDPDCGYYDDFLAWYNKLKETKDDVKKLIND